MKRVVQSLLAALGLCAGCSQPDDLTPNQFTLEFAEALRKADPELKVTIVEDLELKIVPPDGRNLAAFLDNAYDTYKQDPKAKADTIQRFVTSNLETIRAVREGLDRKQIVPVIKDRPWLEETRQALLSRGATEVPEYVYDDLNPDLIIVYAENSPKNIRYLGTEDLKTAGIEHSELRALACENLKRILPDIGRQEGANGIHMIAAGGDYEASLLLLDSIWTNNQMELKGDPVVAIPTRDLLLVTGSGNPEGIEKIRQLAEEVAESGSYRLTSKLFVYRNGSFTAFEGR